MRILIAEPDPALAKRLAQSVRGLEADLAGQPEVLLFTEPDFHAQARQTQPTLILVSLAPEAEPEQVLGGLRQPGRAVIALAGDAAPQFRAACLLAGADDCLSKPLSMVELQARCTVALRRLRISAEPSARLCFDGLVVDRLRRTAAVHGQAVELTGRELLILEQLALAGGMLVSRSALGRAGQGAGQTNALDVHLAALRRKLRLCAGAPEIGTVRGAGFQLLPAPGLAPMSSALAYRPAASAA